MDRSTIASPVMSALGAFLLTSVISGAPLSAQVLSGRVAEEGTGTPVQAVLVELLSPDSVRVRAALSGEGGRYVLPFPEPGRYLIRLRRFGYATSQIGPVELTESRALDLTLPIEPVSFRGFVVVGESRCSVGPDGGASTSRLWNAIRAALEVTAVVQEEGLLEFELLRFEREMDLAETVLLKESLFTWEGPYPFRAVAPESLAQGGFVQPLDSTWLSYLMPDPSVILSETFQDTHCFRSVDGEADGRSLVGLAFEPLEPEARARSGLSRERPSDAEDHPVLARLIEEGVDVSGVLWLDRETGALETLEYGYEGFRSDDLEERAGGYARFEQLADGAWVVRQWWVRMPLLGEFGFTGEPELRPIGLREEGGELIRAATLDGRLAATRAGTRIEGTVTGGADLGIALDRVVVRLSGSPHATRPDSAGRFALLDVPPGRYILTRHHPLLDTVGVRPPARRFDLNIGAGGAEGVIRMDVSLPDRSEIIDEVCPRARVYSDEGVILVHVWDEDGAVVSRERIELDTDVLNRVEEVRRSNLDGFTRFCGVPLYLPVRIRLPDREGTAEATVRLTEPGFARVDLHVAGGG